jgi:hypothetical protein
MEHKVWLKSFDCNLGHFIKIHPNATLSSTHRSAFKEIGLKPNYLFVFMKKKMYVSQVISSLQDFKL